MNTSIFDEDFLQNIAESMPVEGSGLQRTYQLRITDFRFEEAGDKYQAKVKKGEGKVIQAVLSGLNEDDEERSEKYTIGSGWELDGAEGGKTALRVKSTAGYTKFSASSLYGRLYKGIVHEWELTEENHDSCVFALPGENAGEVTISPSGQRFLTWLKGRGLKPDPTNGEIWIGATLQLDKDEYEVDGKQRDRAFPIALLDLEGYEEPEAAPKVDKAAAEKAAKAKAAKEAADKAAKLKADKAAKDAKSKPADKKPDLKPEPEAEAEEEPAADEPEDAPEEAADESATDDDADAEIMGKAFELADGTDDYNTWRGQFMKLPGVKGIGRWTKWALKKEQWPKIKDGTVDAPAPDKA